MASASKVRSWSPTTVGSVRTTSLKAGAGPARGPRTVRESSPAGGAMGGELMGVAGRGSAAVERPRERRKTQ